VQVDLSELVVDRVRKALVDRGGTQGIHAFISRLRRGHDDVSSKVTVHELEAVLNDIGVNMSRKDLVVLLAAIDMGDDGGVTLDEFVMAIRGPTSSRRCKLIDAAFTFLDRAGRGVVKMDEVVERFSTSHHPDAVGGRVSSLSAASNFRAQFGDKDTLSRTDFMEYYQNVSAAVSSDDYFEFLIRGAWRIAGIIDSEAWSGGITHPRILVTYQTGLQNTVVLKSDSGIDVSDTPQVLAQLRKQGVRNVARIEVGKML